eukprot:COSAG01_NODE_14_length_41020_cov_40.702133_23_plen_332_part_00
MYSKRKLTGIKPTGIPHLGNYISAINPAISTEQNNTFFFIADYHALTTLKSAESIKKYTNEVAATWLSCGLNPKKTCFYKQSDIPEVLELYWILMSIAPKGLLNRAHAYKALTDQNTQQNKQADEGINMGIYTYPVLMAADILLFSAEEVPIGKDQLQHLEITRDLAEKFNNEYGDILTLPEGKIEHQKEVPGIDGRKMSKSYNNTISLFSDNKILKKQIMKIQTDSKGIEEIKDPNSCSLYYLFSLFADEESLNAVKQGYLNGGLGYGHVKKMLLELLEEKFKKENELFTYYINNHAELHQILNEGAIKARKIANKKLLEIKEAIGMGTR